MNASRQDQNRIALQAGLTRNLLVIRAMAFFQVFMVIVPVAVPLFGDRGLDIAEILELQAVFGITVVIGEVPSGYVADLFGRRLALVLGAVCLGIGHTLLAFAHDFWGLAAFELALGVGVSLISGADVAVLYDSGIALGHDAERRQRGLGNLFFVKSIAEAGAGLAASLVLLVATLNELVLLQVAIGWLPLLCAWLIVDPPIERMPAGTHLDNLGGVLRALFASGPVVRGTFLMMALWSLTTFYAVWLLQQEWAEEGVSLSAFGVMWALLAVIAGFAGRHAAWLEARLGIARLLLAVALLPALGYFLLAAVGGAWALLVAPLFFVARGAGWVVLQEALNRRLDGSCRATANSLVGFLFRGAYALTVPITGALLRVWSLDAVLLVLGVATLGIFVTVVLPLVRTVRTLVPDLPETVPGSVAVADPSAEG
ncbi:MAG TPA: MFS transporter [Pseudomonadales bacterium]|nr:MFS transporter [Pseudomonadales bacterium]